MEPHDFILAVNDTDSISFGKKDGSPFSEEEQDRLIAEINSMMPALVKYAHDGYFERVIVLKSKNYILFDGKKIKIRGSALKDSKKEAVLKEMSSKIIDSLLHDRTDFKEIYLEYVREAMDIKDIYRWTTKKTITQNVMNGKRANETKVMDAIANSEYGEGDKVFLFFRQDNTLCLAEQYNGDYNEDRFLEKLYKSVQVFSSVIQIEDYFDNFKLKRNKQKLSQI